MPECSKDLPGPSGVTPPSARPADARGALAPSGLHLPWRLGQVSSPPQWSWGWCRAISASGARAVTRQAPGPLCSGHLKPWAEKPPAAGEEAWLCQVGQGKPPALCAHRG